MKKNKREELLKALMLPQRPQHHVPVDKNSAAPQLVWGDLQYVVEGLMFAQRAIRGAVGNIATRVNLLPQGPFILTLIDRGVTYPADLALALNVSRSLITKELQRLIETQLVCVTTDQLDKRRSELTLTPSGLDICNEVRACVVRVLQHNLGNYTHDEVRLFADMLRDARQVAEDVCGTRQS